MRAMDSAIAKVRQRYGNPGPCPVCGAPRTAGKAEPDTESIEWECSAEPYSQLFWPNVPIEFDHEQWLKDPANTARFEHASSALAQVYDDPNVIALCDAYTALVERVTAVQVQTTDHDRHQLDWQVNGYPSDEDAPVTNAQLGGFVADAIALAALVEAVRS